MGNGVGLGLGSFDISPSNSHVQQYLGPAVLELRAAQRRVWTRGVGIPGCFSCTFKCEKHCSKLVVVKLSLPRYQEGLLEHRLLGPSPELLIQ